MTHDSAPWSRFRSRVYLMFITNLKISESIYYHSNVSGEKKKNLFSRNQIKLVKEKKRKEDALWDFLLRGPTPR